MSGVNSLHTYAASASTWDSIKSGVVDAAGWVARQGKWVVKSVADFMMKIYEFAKPFFVGVARFIVNFAQAIREFFIENKQLTVGAAIGIGIGAVGLMLVQYFCFNEPQVT